MLYCTWEQISIFFYISFQRQKPDSVDVNGPTSLVLTFRRAFLRFSVATVCDHDLKVTAGVTGVPNKVCLFLVSAGEC